ncbi:hypothetical protein Zmor_022806 [Zophobas morio]|uniref:Peptidase C1A papain C-terminal domain-containing protein n=2 Tax=Zophobas morio TaxID=2755281 RepID=A0AA38I1N0_9CUCU|nr:hypothetical protein Zmor_022806 [Zophobas morio]
MNPTLQVAVILALSSLSWAKVDHLSDKFIDEINAKQTTWVAGRNFPEDTPVEQLKRLAGTFRPLGNKKVPIKIHKVVPEDIPDTFDGRTYWSQCESLKNIRDQGACGSCWAFAASEAITDRTCIASNGAIKFKASPEELISCCEDCASSGCSGGYMDRAWNYWVENGLVSGGDYNSNEGCQPYQAEAYQNGVTPSCTNTCLNTNYGTSYSADKHYGKSWYQLANDVGQIQTDIMQNGPVEVYLTVYNDFYSYKSGVYVHTSGDEAGGHAVKIIGWGTENGTPYWLIANSWGSGWADLDGFFKILRGQNHCDIES